MFIHVKKNLKAVMFAGLWFCLTYPTAVRAEDVSCSVRHLCGVWNIVTVSAGSLGEFKMFSSVKTMCVSLLHGLQYIYFMFKWNQSPVERDDKHHSVNIWICSYYMHHVNITKNNNKIQHVCLSLLGKLATWHVTLM